MTRLAICTSNMLVAYTLVASTAACGDNGSSMPGETCGDGVLDIGEECDDGNNARGDGCFECVIEPMVCGNGILDINEECDDSNTLDGDGCSSTCEQEIPPRVIMASWTFKNLAGNTTTGCPATFDSVKLVATTLDGAESHETTFTCAAGAGTTDFIPPGQYNVHLEVFQSATPANVYALSLPERVDISLGDAPLVATIFNDAGYFSFDWTLRGAISLMDFTCAQVGANNVRATVTGPTPVAPMFPCVDGSAITVPLLAGTTYSITFEALNNGVVMGTLAFTNQTITAPNDVTALGAVIIPIDNF